MLRITATIELPGLNKDNVQIDVQNGSMNTSGETKRASEHEESVYAECAKGVRQVF
jgi:HSP20 family protein